jgi:hypothetical protein
MTKKLNDMRWFFILLLAFAFQGTLAAQDSCDCEIDFNEPFVCAQDENGEVFHLPNACFADCLGFTIVEEGCDDFDWEDPWEDCDCEIDHNEPFVCAQDSVGVQHVVPNACIADCLGLTIIEDGCDDWGGGEPWGDCGCEVDFNEPFVCVQDESGAVFPLPNACFADCLGLTIVEDDCDGFGWEDPWEDCDCEIDYNEPFVCAQDSAGVQCLVPNACIADCLGLTIIEDGCDDWGGGEPWGDCDCEIDPNESFVCVEDQDGFLLEVPNACFADCFGFTLAGDDCYDWGGDDPWTDCDCEIDLDEPFVCAQDSTGAQCLVPNACFADCLGLTVVEDGCDGGIIIGGDDDTALGLCIASLDLEGTQLFQTFLLLLNSECGLPLDDCILDAPAFDNDDDFFTYLMDNCFADGDLQGDDSMLRLFNSYRDVAGATATSSTATASLANEVTLLQNPVTDVLRYRVTAASPDRITVRVVGISGQTLQQTALDVQTGLNDYSIDLGNLPAGLYLLSVMGEHSLTTLRFVRN